jgi:hypothetical protein
MSYFTSVRITNPLTPFNEVLTGHRQNIIELKSNVNVVSALRDLTTVVGSATVTAANSEYALATTAAASDSAILDSAEKGRYQAGYAAEVGIGIRYPDTPTGNMQAKWGYFDNNNGFYFGRDATGIFIATLRGGSEIKVYQNTGANQWNADKLDGTGASGLTLDLADGNIFQIRYSWYGYGTIEFTVILPDANNVQKNIMVHRFSATAQTSIIDPNQPIRAKIENGATATAHTLYVGGRQYSVLGSYNPNVRNTGQYRLLQGSITSAAFVPLITFRRKAAYNSTSVKVRHLTLITNQDVIIQVRVGGSLTGASYITPSDYTAQETAVEADISATAITGGDIIDDDIIEGGVGNQSNSRTYGTVGFDFVNQQPTTLCAKAVSTTATVTSHFSVIEEW